MRLKWVQQVLHAYVPWVLPVQVRYDYSKKRVVSEPLELSQEFR
jgi:hypothetical protein